MPKDRSKEILKEIRSLRSELTGRLDALEGPLGSTPRDPANVQSAPYVPPPPDLPDPEDDRPSPGGFQMPTDRNISVVIQPLRDLSMARIVEQALADTEGVESSTLRELRGDSATIETRVDEGVSLITSLRRRLPVAFDVTASDKGSFTIALAQPQGKRSDGVAGQEFS